MDKNLLVVRRRSSITLNVISFLIGIVGIYGCLFDFEGTESAGNSVFFFIILFMSCCVAIYGAVCILRTPTLIFEYDNFTLCGGLILRPKVVLWGDVAEFFPHSLRVPGLFAVGYKLTPDVRNKALSSWTSGIPRCLPIIFSPRDGDLVEEMNGYRLRALAHPPVQK